MRAFFHSSPELHGYGTVEGHEFHHFSSLSGITSTHDPFGYPRATASAIDLCILVRGARRGRHVPPSAPSPTLPIQAAHEIPVTSSARRRHRGVPLPVSEGQTPVTQQHAFGGVVVVYVRVRCQRRILAEFRTIVAVQCRVCPSRRDGGGVPTRTRSLPVSAGRSGDGTVVGISREMLYSITNLKNTHNYNKYYSG